MKCVNPRKLPNKASVGFEDRYIQVSCGKCYACLSNRRRSWLFRLMQENLNSVISLFVTLTYDDFNVLLSGGDSLLRVLYKPHLQNFIKRLRHYEDFTYYAIGEYGTTTQRPHYHLVIFFKSCPASDPLDCLTELINNTWPYGFCSVSRASYRRLNYVLHYHTRPKLINGLPTFQLFSKALGIHFLDESMIAYLVKTKKSTIKDFNGNTYVIPRYYRKKLKDLGYDVDPSEPQIWHSDWNKEAIEKAFNKPVYQISSSEVARYLKERLQISMNKVNKYNNQDKFI